MKPVDLLIEPHTGTDVALRGVLIHDHQNLYRCRRLVSQRTCSVLYIALVEVQTLQIEETEVAESSLGLRTKLLLTDIVVAACAMSPLTAQSNSFNIFVIARTGPKLVLRVNVQGVFGSG